MKTLYNRKLNEKPKLLKFYTPWELFTLVLIFVSPMVLAEVLHIDSNIFHCFILGVLYTLFLVYFKIGRPEGYLHHLIAQAFTPMHFRPGHKSPSWPIIEDEKWRNMPSVSKEELTATEIQIFDLGMIPVGSGRYMIRNTIANTDLEAEYIAILNSGKPISRYIQYGEA